MEIRCQWFQDYEAREAFFRENVSSLIPASYRGPNLFWREFSAITAKDVSRQALRKTACITAFPQDGLAFAAPLQILRAAAAGQNDAGTLENQAIELFRLAPLLNQALRTLSGGEIVRLALAKAWLNAATHQELYLASPYSWLDKHNNGLTDTVARAYLERNKPVTFLALEGENTDSERGSGIHPPAKPAPLPPVTFSLTAKDLQLKLSQSLMLGAAPLWARTNDFTFELASPCLILGENGAGKSLLVKTLAKVNGRRGALEIKSGDNLAPCRLLQQNTLSQSLLRVKEQFAPVSSGPLRTEFRRLYALLHKAVMDGSVKSVSADSLLDLKLKLAAACLCQNPKLLILDEPEWGLSYAVATAFVYGVCGLAHAHGVPVALVSHKNWWLKLARSRLLVTKKTAPKAHKQLAAFGIHIGTEQPCED